MTAPPTPALGGAERVRLTLSREITCIRALAWRFDLPATSDWPALAGALQAAGFVPRAPLGSVVRFSSPTGDEVLLVTATGRVQLRVHYAVPQHERSLAAERLFQLLVYAWIRPGDRAGGANHE
jgi:hypothetical protein